jgi:hypothetical protein
MATKKSAEKALSKKLYEEHAKLNPNTTHTFTYLLKGENTRRGMVKVEYSPVGFLDRDELDIKLRSVYSGVHLLKVNNAERSELYSAAINDYFINHAA